MNNKSGCLMWVILFCFILLWGWKLVDFYILAPAVVKKGMNESVDMVRGIHITEAKQVEFLEVWAEYERSSDIQFEITSFQGDSFIVQWSDTLYVPVFPSIPHTYRLAKIVI